MADDRGGEHQQADELSALLAAANLPQHEAALRELGCQSPADLAECDEQDLLDVGMMKVEVKRLVRQVRELAARPPPSAGPAMLSQRSEIRLGDGVRVDVHDSEVVGRGGSGVVYVGTMHDRSGSKKVAVKMLGAGATAKQQADFVKEIRKSLVIAMKYEGVVLTYGAVEHAGQTALVMKLYEGGSLAALLGQLDPGTGFP